MRPTLWISLLVCCVLAAGLRLAPSRAEVRPATVVGGNVVNACVERPSQPAGTSYLFKENVEGNGVTEDAARERALANACERVTAFLAEKHNETDFKPKPELLQKLNILPAINAISVADHPIPDYPTMKKATIQVQISEKDLKSLQLEARQERAVQRQHWMGMGLAGVVALLLVAVGYLRLEEATKGYYTGLLRVSALGLLGLAGFCIYRLS